jgi:hypothetical protein
MHIVVAKQVLPSWEVVEQFTVPSGAESYAYVRAAWADAKSRATHTGRAYEAFVLPKEMVVGRQFSYLGEHAIEIDDEFVAASRRAAGLD